MQGTREKLFDCLKSRLRGGLLRSKEISLKFVNAEEDVGDSLTEEVLPVIKQPDTHKFNFNVDCYRENLKSKTLGNTVFYTPVIKTTMTLFDG